MDKAKAAVGSFLHKDGKHDTTVHETVNPAVTQENVTRTQHENVTTAVDREVHQSTTPPPLSPLSPWTNSRRSWCPRYYFLDREGWSPQDPGYSWHSLYPRHWRWRRWYGSRVFHLSLFFQHHWS